ncbi:MAG TPA: hypothetical protein VMY77_16165 [Chitinophagaceae bacterium]|nr:hypothetical protein [Chitinophagaceae bacterium]
MRKIVSTIAALCLYYTTYCQGVVNRQQFFLDETLIEVTFTTDIKKLRSDKKIPEWQPANIVMHFSDTSVITEEIRVQPRGEFRKLNCDIASLMLDFKNISSPKLSPLKKLKLVGGCRSSGPDEQLLLKEFLIYKIYNFLTNMSFRTRLMHVNYKDSKGKIKSYSQYAFLIEDIKDLCTRNNCLEPNKKTFRPGVTNRQQKTLVCMFQYMIGNTDWSLPNFHNIKMIVPKTDTFAPPYIIPYDFDYTGLVDAHYAVPQEQFGNTTLQERVYRGEPRSTEELQQVIDIFKEKRERIIYYINEFPLLGAKTKRDVVAYIDQFYETINSKNSWRAIFKAEKN